LTSVDWFSHIIYIYIYIYDSYDFENILLISTCDNDGGGGGGICTSGDSGCASLVSGYISGGNVSRIKAPYFKHLRNEIFFAHRIVNH
jgi:hypothetical protein